jgi:hypothetical protein
LDLPDRHTFRLELPGLPELADLARAFLGRTIRFADFEGDDARTLCDAACAALARVEEVVESRHDFDLPIEVRVVVDAEALEVSILERGTPLAGAPSDARGIRGLRDVAAVFDGVRWEQRGAEGSELHLRRYRPHPEITALVQVEHRLAVQRLEQAESEPRAPADLQYVFRDFRPQDALEVSRRIYESYGRSYPNPDLFYPERIVALNRSGRLRSIVAQAPDGSIVGHYAIERPRLRPIGESGLAVIDPPHRGRGLLKQMRTKLVEVSGSLGLLGLWSQPTARHPYSQRMNISQGSTACGLSLGTTPASTLLRGGARGDVGLRASCFLYWDPLVDEEPLEAYVPEVVAPLVAAIYEARGRNATLSTDLGALPAASVHGENAVRTRFDRARRSGSIEVDRIDAGSHDLVAEAIQLLVDVAGAEVVYVDLPITDPGCARLAGELLGGQLHFAGIGPRFLGEDSFRLQRLVAPVDLDGLVVEGELGARIAEQVLSSVPA